MLLILLIIAIFVEWWWYSCWYFYHGFHFPCCYHFYWHYHLANCCQYRFICSIFSFFSRKAVYMKSSRLPFCSNWDFYDNYSNNLVFCDCALVYDDRNSLKRGSAVNDKIEIYSYSLDLYIYNLKVCNPYIYIFVFDFYHRFYSSCNRQMLLYRITI